MSIDNVKYIGPTPGQSTSSPSIVEGGTVVGGRETLLITDMTSRELLEGIYIELKKLNLRQEAVFGEQVNDGDV